MFLKHKWEVDKNRQHTMKYPCYAKCQQGPASTVCHWWFWIIISNTKGNNLKWVKYHIYIVNLKKMIICNIFCQFVTKYNLFPIITAKAVLSNIMVCSTTYLELCSFKFWSGILFDAYFAVRIQPNVFKTQVRSR